MVKVKKSEIEEILREIAEQIEAALKSKESDQKPKDGELAKDKPVSPKEEKGEKEPEEAVKKPAEPATLKPPEGEAVKVEPKDGAEAKPPKEPVENKKESSSEESKEGALVEKEPTALQVPPTPGSPPEEAESKSPVLPETPKDPLSVVGPPGAGVDVNFLPEALIENFSKLSDEQLEACVEAALQVFENRSAKGAPLTMDPVIEAPAAAVAPVAKNDETAEKIANLEKLVKSQQDNIDGLVKAMNGLFNKPSRRGVVAISETPTKKDVSQLSKSEVMDKLEFLSSKEDLAKSDRSLINGFCCGSVKLDQIAHLFQ